MVHQLQTRSYKSSRYKLGLPANGQRTHTNANTTGRVSDEGAKFIRKKRIVARVWEARKPAKFISKGSRGNDPYALDKHLPLAHMAMGFSKGCIHFLRYSDGTYLHPSFWFGSNHEASLRVVIRLFYAVFFNLPPRPIMGLERRVRIPGV